MKIKTFAFVIFAVLITIYLGIKLLGNGGTGYSYEEMNVIVGDKNFTLEIADTPGKQSKGLMNRQYLDDDKGMIFIFNKSGIYPFWMKNTYIPLDIIWLDEIGTIVYIKESAQPCKSAGISICKSIIPTKVAKYVIELNAGKVKELGITKDQVVDVP